MSIRAIVSWCLPRILLALVALAPTAGCDGGKKPPSPKPPATKPPATKVAPGPAEVCPPLADWSQTSVAGVEIAAAEPDRISVKTLELDAELPAGAKAVGPLVSIEPEVGAAPPQRIRMRLPEGVSPSADDAKRLSLACYSVSFSTSQKTLTGAWYTHAAKYDPATRTVEAGVSHASIWMIVTNTDEHLPSEILTEHCRIHIPPKVPQTAAVVAADALEKAYAQLESFGLRAGRDKNNRLDVYFQSIVDKDGGVIYAGHNLTTTGGSYIVLNLPSEIPNFSLEELRASASHELFHEFQFKYQNINTFLDVWVSGARKANEGLETFLDNHVPGYKASKSAYNPTGWLKDKVFKLEEYNYPFGWLNEAMSTWYQFKAAPKWTPDSKDTVYGWSGAFLTGGLGSHRNKDIGYGGAVFVDHMVARYGTGFLREVLESCKRQGRSRNTLAAIREACMKIGVARQDPSMVVFDDAWLNFADNILIEDATPPFNSRLDRNQLITAKSKLHTVQVGSDPVLVKRSLGVRPLGMLRQGFRVVKMRGETWTKVVCEIRQVPATNAVFPAKTALFYTAGKPGPRAPLPSGSNHVATLDDESPSQTVVMTLDKAGVLARLELLAVGLWGDKGPADPAVDRHIDYELTFTPVDDGPKDVDSFFPEVKYFPGYQGPWRTSKGKATNRSTGKQLSANRTYFYAPFVQGGPPTPLHILRVVVEIKDAAPLAKDAFEAKLKAIKADTRVVNLRSAGVTGTSVSFTIKGIKEPYDKDMQTRDVVVFQEDRNLVEVAWSSFKPGEPWANRRDATLEKAREVAQRIRGTFRAVLPEPPGGNAMSRAIADVANLDGPEGVRAVAIYGLSLAHASAQSFHEPWFDQIVELQAQAEKETARFAALALTTKPLTKIPARYADTAAVIQALRKRKAQLEAKRAELRKNNQDLSGSEKAEFDKHDERLAVVERVAAEESVAKQIAGILFPKGDVKPHSGTVGDSLLKSLGVPRLWPDRLNSPDPRKAGDAEAVTAAKDKLWRAARQPNKVEATRSHMKTYAHWAGVAVRISKLQDQVPAYNAAAEAYLKRIEAGDYRACMAAAADQ